MADITIEGPEVTPAPKKSGPSPFLLIIVPVILFIILGSVGLAFRDDDNESSAPDKVSLEDADEAADSPYVDLEDDGASLFIDSEGEDSIGASIDDAVLALMALDVPDSVLNRMENTRALDGTQEATWGDFTAIWTYHPDDGLDIVITEQAD